MHPQIQARASLSRLYSRILGISAAVLFVASTASQAAVTLVGQTRAVGTFATIDFVEGEDDFSNDMIQSQEGGVFEEQANCHVGVPGNQATSAGHLLSYIEPNLILAEGSMFGQSEITSEATFAEGFGMARIVSLFSVDTPTEIHVQASLFAGGNGAANLVFRLQNSTIFIHRSLHDGEDDVDEVILLQPGMYELTAVTSGYGQALPNGGGQPASGSYSVSIMFPASTGAPAIAHGAANPFAPVVAPNPVRGTTRISPASGTAGLFSAISGEIVILDLAGRVVRRFVGVDANGVTWDARDTNGAPVAAGIYLVRGGTGESTRAVVLR